MSHINYRNIKADLLLIFSLILTHGQCIESEEITPIIISQKVICKEPGRYIGWPTITKTLKGELLIVFSGDRDSHACPWGKTQLVRSSDDGNTWSAPVTINNTPLDDRDAGIIETREGTFLITWFTSLAFETIPKYYQHAEKITPEIREKWLGYWMRRSEDGGKTWGEPYKTVTSTIHGPAQLKNGRLLFVNRSKKAFGSHDDGRTWKQIATIPSPDGESLSEPHVVETKDGKLVAMFRCQPKENRSQSFLRQSESIDGGKTWSPVHKTPIWGFPPHLLQLDNGWLLVIYGRRLYPFSIRGCISKDGGETWDIENEIIIRDAPNTDFGYPSSVQFDDGSIWTVYYMVDKPGEKPCLMGTHWRLN